MNILLIVVVVIVVVGVVALLVANPKIKQKEADAIEATREGLGGRDKIILIDPRTTAMGFEPAGAGTLNGMTCLGVNQTQIMAVALSSQDQWRVDRSAVTKVEAEADDPSVVQKTTIMITYGPPGDEAVARFRIKDPVPWLTELGYDWGPDGPPDLDAGGEDDD